MRKRSCELVIHITSVSESSFLFYFTIFSHLQFAEGSLKIPLQGSLKTLLCRLFSPVLILANINLFGSFVFVGFLLVLCSYQLMQWDRNTAGRLERLSAPVEQGCEINLHTNQMETPSEEQQSQQGVQREPNAYRSMRDHIHPPRVSALAYIIPPAEDVAVRPYLVPLLQIFHGMENENPYTHIRDFEEVCTTFKEGDFDMDLLKLNAFPLTLKDKAKIWLNSLRPRTIRNWAKLQAEFLKNFFSSHKTNNLKRQIYTFAAHDSEKFYQCWERYLETINACPHHGFDTWMLVNHFYDGMSPSMKQLLETICGGDFLIKNPD